MPGSLGALIDRLSSEQTCVAAWDEARAHLVDDNQALLHELDAHLATRSYIGGFVASFADAFLAQKLLASATIARLLSPSATWPHLARWARHVQANDKVRSMASLVKQGQQQQQQQQQQGGEGQGQIKPQSKSLVPKKPPVKMGKTAEGKADHPPLKELKPWPTFIDERNAIFDRMKAEHEQAMAAKEKKPITITLPDGKQLEGISWQSTPYELARGISQGLADNAIVAKINGVLWDLDRPLEESCTLELLKFDDNEEAQDVFWHSSAHVLGEALERTYGCHLCYGPAIEGGFFYDMYIEDRTVSNHDYKGIEDMVKKIVKEKQPFERLVVKKETLLEMFAHNEFKMRIVREKVKTPTTTVYRCGPLIDLCRGPHLRNTGKIKSFCVTKSSATYWEGNCEAESLQRVYGVSFPDPKQMKEWKHLQEEAAKRDHRKIGKEQELFFFNELSPGCCFFHPRGAHIYNKLVDLMKEEYWIRGFQEVMTPNIFNKKLWETSGHWQHYSEDMFHIEVDKEQFGLKPMNCPSHCLIFDQGIRSWKEMPLRLADFGVLHRNEMSGALTGLTRVRRFQQDDAHIFCRPDQLREEIGNALEFLQSIYTLFGYTYNLKLSTRPDKYLGEIELWDKAEKALAESLDASGLKWKLNPGDGAFYGPKIDIALTDALKRQHQCATIQLDFQLPIRFQLGYVDETGAKQKPVIIHRAILGSVERHIAIMTEHFGGKWPFWISPRQAMVVPVGPPFNDYAKDVQRRLRRHRFWVDIDIDNSNTMNKKVRNAQLAQYNFILVVGEKEQSHDSVNVRTRDNKVHGEVSVDALIAKFKVLAEDRVLKSEEWDDGQEGEQNGDKAKEEEKSKAEKKEAKPKQEKSEKKGNKAEVIETNGEAPKANGEVSYEEMKGDKSKEKKGNKVEANGEVAPEKIKVNGNEQ